MDGKLRKIDFAIKWANPHTRTHPGTRQAASSKQLPMSTSSSSSSSAMEQMAEELRALRMENEKLKKGKPTKGFRLQVAKKGGLSVYGLNKLPVTLYKQQWRLLLLEKKDDILAFLEENDAELTEKAKDGNE